MKTYPAYQPIPALVPQWLDAAGCFLRERAQGIPERPLGLISSHAADDEVPQPTLVVPTDLLIAAWRQLFPAERMLLIAGRRRGGVVYATSLRDVTGESRSVVYVKASAALLHEVFLDWEATGAHLVGWIHSHPGVGPLASQPSQIDHRQDRDLRASYGDRVVGLIVTQDGWLRVWGQAVDDRSVRLQLQGAGIAPARMCHVYRLAVR